MITFNIGSVGGASFTFTVASLNKNDVIEFVFSNCTTDDMYNEYDVIKIK